MAKAKQRVKKSKKRHMLACFEISINILLTGEKFCLTEIQPSTKVNDLKRKIELVAGIPQQLQRLQYLDEGDLLDDSDLRSNDVVPYGTLRLRIWRTWVKLVDYVIKGDIEGVMNTLADPPKLKYSSLDPLLYKNELQETSDQAAIALFIAAHRGHRNLINKLIDNGYDINRKTQYGRTPLHAAAASGNCGCIDLMLERGALMDVTDKAGRSPLSIANEFGNKDSERRLFLFQWQKRTNKHEQQKSEKQARPLMMHQQFDSGFPTWIKGSHAQIYLCSTLPPGEFVGSAINARKSESRKPPFQTSSGNNAVNSVSNIDEPTLLPKINETDVSKRSPKTFQTWLKEKRREREAKELLDSLKVKEEKEKPWGKELPKGSRKLDRLISFRAWEEEKSRKDKQRLVTPVTEDKPKRKLELYEEYDFSPRFEQKFLLQKLETLDGNISTLSVTGGFSKSHV